MGNTRFPGKNGMLIQGKPQIWHVLNRIKRATTFREIMMAIPHESNGGVMIHAARELGVAVLDYYGDPNDVVHRYALAADIMDADIVVRIPGDNTFIDPDEIDRIVNFYNEDPAPWNWLTTNLDLNVLGNGYPAGLGAEVYDVRFINWLDKNIRDPQLREHPHKWAFENSHIRTIPAPEHLRRPELKLSVDTPAEFKWTSDVYDALYPTKPNFRIRDILAYLEEKKS